MYFEVRAIQQTGVAYSTHRLYTLGRRDRTGYLLSRVATLDIYVGHDVGVPRGFRRENRRSDVGDLPGPGGEREARPGIGTRFRLAHTGVAHGRHPI